MNDRAYIEERLGIPFNVSLRGTISHLNRVPAFLITTGRQLDDPKLARSLLAFYVTMEDRPYLELFVQEVVFGTIPAERWMRGRILVPDFSLGDLVLQPGAALLDPVAGGGWTRIVPSAEAWQGRLPWLGALCRAEPHADYRSAIPAHTVSIAEVPVEGISDGRVALRRWIAARLAMDLDRRGLLGPVEHITQIVPPGLPALRRWSGDALAAAQGLLMERKNLDRLEAEIPGFSGPDAWYQGSNPLP